MEEVRRLSRARVLDKPATIKDVARVAGVSFATVSRVINNSKPVDEPTRTRVLQAVAELRYMPNTLARGLQTRQTYSLGVMLPEIGTSIMAQIVGGIESYARQRGYTILLMTTSTDPTRELECLSMMRQQQVDGVIWVAAMFTPLHEEWLRHHELRIVALGQDFSAHGLPSLIVDNHRAAYEATRHLLSRGHRKIAMIAGKSQDRSVGLRRLHGFEDALLDAGISLDSSLVTTGSVASQRSGYDAMAQLVEHHPTAVLAASDTLAIGAMQLLLERGLSIPEDISIMGFDDLDVAAHPLMRLSTVAFDFTGIGQEAVRTLIEPLKEKAEAVPGVQSWPHRLVLRDSVRQL